MSDRIEVVLVAWEFSLQTVLKVGGAAQLIESVVWIKDILRSEQKHGVHPR
jgi:hypothetical protein